MKKDDLMLGKQSLLLTPQADHHVGFECVID